MSDSENHQNGMFPEWEKGSEKSGNSADALHLIETGKPNGKQHLDFTDHAVVNKYETSESGTINIWFILNKKVKMSD